jgi:hypothetical protein
VASEVLPAPPVRRCFGPGCCTLSVGFKQPHAAAGARSNKALRRGCLIAGGRRYSNSRQAGTCAAHNVTTHYCAGWWLMCARGCAQHSGAATPPPMSDPQTGPDHTASAAERPLGGSCAAAICTAPTGCRFQISKAESSMIPRAATHGAAPAWPCVRENMGEHRTDERPRPMASHD